MTTKDRQLSANRRPFNEGVLTTDQGIPVEDTDNSLRAGARGPSLLEDFHLREKIMRFDHERIPERVVHARGTGAHGVFKVYEPLDEYTTADFLTDPDAETPVFVRFSTVQGSRGSSDTPRDVRGFATKFYTRQGNFDLVGNNMPVFFIQDGIKFPDLVHALKPEPQNEMPQAASAHDSFWDFVTLQPETMHHVIWLMSDRAIPRSFRMMQGFGVHTFRLVNGQGRSTFVKFHWTPVLGTHSLVWDEAQKIAGKDPDYNRRDLWEAISSGQFPSWELGLQLIPEERAFEFEDIDILDPTKIIPEEVVPVTPVGRLTLNRNPDNFFAETEQVAFCVGNVVPGIDFTDDPLLQARLFSYLDTQLNRFGGANFFQVPINRAIAPIRNHQQDGFQQHEVPVGRANYFPNSLGGDQPTPAGPAGFVHYPEHVDGPKERKRSETFADHYSQATLFWNSMSSWEKEHIIAAYRFELGKVESMPIRVRLVEHLNRVDHDLAIAVALGIGVEEPVKSVDNHGRSSPALSQGNSPRESVLSRKVAVLVGDGVDARIVTSMRDTLTERGAIVELLAPVDGTITTSDGLPMEVTRAMQTMSSVLYDAIVVPDGAPDLAMDGLAVNYAAEAFKHGKAVGAFGTGLGLLQRAQIPLTTASADPALIAYDEWTPDFATEFTKALAAHRNFDRDIDAIPA
ncbi:catalase [Dactylosporangium roseum]|uniref:Catalase n=1 Tax=Dactylosporangium roseum TaxID=47989 RepID=A0ABY5ZA20_9ACTN|nr:catalase [Dactylosporangium roseum]UWZ38509.1 catalase [Dactylosporangium roseum]